MPATPLARGMSRYVSVLAADSAHTCSDEFVIHAQASTSKATAPVPLKERNVMPVVMHISSVGVDAPILACSSALPSKAPKSPEAPMAGGDVDACVARYQSRDENGRVWGAPSAFGKGQCLDCPERAAPPSMRCIACQRRAAQAEPMSAGDLQLVQITFSGLLEGTSGMMHDDIIRRLDQLYSKLKGGHVAQSVQRKLLDIAKALSVSDIVAAHQEVVAISAQHWEHHKDWIIGLRRLLSESVRLCLTVRDPARR